MELTIELADEDIAHLEDLARHCREINRERDGATTHGSLDVPALLAMLGQDAAMFISSPESPQAARIADLLTAHGYEP